MEMKFGDSALEFDLRVFVTSAEQIATTRHELLMEIDRKFRAAGIEIPFPQRDLHVRSVDASAVAVFAADLGGAA